MVKKVKAVSKNKKSLIIGGVSGAVVLLIAVAVWVNFGVIKDLIVGMGYSPSSEMVGIRRNLGLTGTGQRIFNAVMPELMERQAFNQNCREPESEGAILGCYKDERVYVYNIVDNELKGIRELTSAHELLHAVYARMSDSKKAELVEPLTRVFEANQEILEKEIDLYDTSQKQEELYVRAGTEIKDLPEVLEKHYAEIFENQDMIVDFYNSYIKVFREIEKNLEELFGKIQAKEAEINAKNAAYKAEAEALNNDIEEFNNCAKTPDCFTSSWAFNNKRQVLVGRKEAAVRTYEEINAMVAEYNQLVTEYNNNVLHGQVLNTVINSGTSVEDF